MKKLLAVAGLAVLLAGCASSNNGMGGTGDESTKTDSLNQNSNGSQGMGATTTTNDATGVPVQSPTGAPAQSQ